MERLAIEGKALYVKLNDLSNNYLSTTEHEKFRWNLRGPTQG